MAWHTVTCKCKENKQGGGGTDTFVDGINITHKGVSDGDQYTVQLSRNDGETLTSAFTVSGRDDTDTRVGGYGTAVHATEHTTQLWFEEILYKNGGKVDGQTPRKINFDLPQTKIKEVNKVGGSVTITQHTVIGTEEKYTEAFTFDVGGGGGATLDFAVAPNVHTTDGTDLPTRLYGKARAAMLAAPDGWALVTMNGKQYAIPAYEVK